MNNHDNKEKDIKQKSDKDRNFIFRPWITKNGKRIYAKSYGNDPFPPRG